MRKVIAGAKVQFTPFQSETQLHSLLEDATRRLRHAQNFCPGEDLGAKAVSDAIVDIDRVLSELDKFRR